MMTSEIRVFAFADQLNPMVCHLARSLEVAGGHLHVLGLRDGRKTVAALEDLQEHEQKELFL